MTPDQLRELADRLRPMAAAPVFDGLDVPAIGAWLRQCAEQSTRTIVTPLAGLAPTHRCIRCAALWRQCDDGSWNLRSGACGPCCDGGDMSAAHIEPLYAAPTAAQPMSDEQRRAIEDAAYERAAKACEQRLGFVSMFASSYDCHLYNAAVRDCAAAIRALNGDAK